MVEYLVDRATKVKSVDDVIMDLKISNGDKCPHVKINDAWKELPKLSLFEIRNKNVDDILDTYEKELNVTFSHEIRTQIKNIQNAINNAWDDKSKKFKVAYKYNSFNQLHQLIIPLQTPEIDDIVIQEIYDKNGNFVAEEFEKEISVDLYKLESYDLYAPSLKSRTIYKKEKNSFKQRFNTNLNKNDETISSYTEIFPIIFFSLFILTPYTIMHVLDFSIIIYMIYSIIAFPALLIIFLIVLLYILEFIKTYFQDEYIYKKLY